MREKEGYRETIGVINTAYPGKIALSVTEAAKSLGIDRRTVISLIRSNKLNAIDCSKGKQNSRYLIPVTSLAKMITSI